MCYASITSSSQVRPSWLIHLEMRGRQKRQCIQPTRIEIVAGCIFFGSRKRYKKNYLFRALSCGAIEGQHGSAGSFPQLTPSNACSTSIPPAF